MHRSVLQNRAYRKYSAAHTVEVLAMEELDRAVAEKSPTIATYPARDAYGDDVAYLVEFAGLTLDQLRALSSGKPLEYMDGGRIPYTAIVDPHDLSEMEGIKGVRTAAQLIAAIKKHAAALVAEHGPGVDRKLWNDVVAAEPAVDGHLATGRVARALQIVQSLEQRAPRPPQPLGRRLAALRTSCENEVDGLEKALADPERRVGAKKELAALVRILGDGALAERVRALLSETD